MGDKMAPGAKSGVRKRSDDTCALDCGSGGFGYSAGGLGVDRRIRPRTNGWQAGTRTSCNARHHATGNKHAHEMNRVSEQDAAEAPPGHNKQCRRYPATAA